MYKHNTLSIKESENKRFISKQDKDKYDAIESSCRTIEDTYSKTEIDDKIMNRIADNSVLVNTNILPATILDTEDGYISDIEIFGNTQFKDNSRYIVPTPEYGKLNHDTGEPQADDNYVRFDTFTQVNEHEVLEVYGYHYNQMYSYVSHSFHLCEYDANRRFIGYKDCTNKKYVVDDHRVKYVKAYFDKNIEGAKFFMIKSEDKTNIQSIGELQPDGTYNVSIKTCGRNLFDKRTVKDINCSAGTATLENHVITVKASSSSENIAVFNHGLRVKPNTKYTVVCKFEGNEYAQAPEIYCLVYNLNCTELINRNVWNDTRSARQTDGNKIYRTFETTSEQNFIKFRFDNNGTKVNGQESIMKYYDIMFYEGEYDPELEYEEYEEHEVVLNLPCKLQKVGDVADRLFTKDGKIFIEKNIKETKLTCDNSVWVQHSLPSDHDDTCGMFYLYHDKNTWLDIKKCTDVVGKYFENRHYQEPGGECIFNGTVAVAVQIKRSKLPSENLFGFMEWLRLNAIELVYVTTNPYIIEVTNQVIPLLKTNNGITTIVRDNVPFSRFIGSLPISLSNSLSKNINNISMLKDEVNDIKSLVKKSAYNIENESRVFKIESNGELVDGIEIQGKSVRNAIDTKFYTQPTLTLENTTNIKTTEVFQHIRPGLDSRIDIENGVVTVTKIAQEYNYTNLFVKKSMYNIKPNTIYTYVVEVLENTLVNADGSQLAAVKFGNTDNKPAGDNQMTIFADSWGMNIYSKNVGVFKMLMRTRPKEELDLMSNDWVGDRIFVRDQTTGTIKFRVALLEGDHTYTDITTLGGSGLISSADSSTLKVKSTNKNLLDVYGPKQLRPSSLPFGIQDGVLSIGDEKMDIGTYANVKYIVYLEKGKQYDVTYNAIKSYSDRAVFDCKYIGKNADMTNPVYVDGSTGKNGKRITASQGDGWYQFSFFATSSDTTVGKVELANVGIYEITDSYVWENYKECKNQQEVVDLTKYGIEGGLKSLADGTCDRIFKQNGKYYLEKNIGVKVFDGSESWIPCDTQLTNTFSVYCDDIKGGCYGTNMSILCDKYPHQLSTIDEPYNSNITDYPCTFTLEMDTRTRIVIRELKTKCTNIQEFKELLQSSPITVYYKLFKPEIIELNNDFDIRLFEGYNRIEVHTSKVIPKIKITKSGALQNTIDNLLTKIKNLSSRDINNARLTLDSIYTADMTNYMIDISRGVSYTNVESHYDEELFELIYSIVSCGKNNYNLFNMEEKIDFFCIIDKLSFEMCDILFDIMYSENEDEDIEE